jgi:signal transduction histidine kinase
VRFDDRLATALAQPAESPAARQAVWRQLIDLLAQPRTEFSPLRHEAFARIQAWRPELSVSCRQNAALALAGQRLPLDLVAFFADDNPAVSAPLLASVQMAKEDWRELIPRLSPVARSLLRHRRDLPKSAVRALEAFGQADLVISGPLHEPEPEVESDSDHLADIHALRERIEALRTAQLKAAASSDRGDFAFETGADGVIRWCDLPARAAVMGVSIAETVSGPYGVDGQAAGAFRRRAPFRDARMTLAGPDSVKGEWCISAVPDFDETTGRFTGYRGTARRPRLGERAERTGLFGTTLTSDSLRQLAHEVRTPLNAIAGFAEMIERQMLGPASVEYRARAGSIIADAQRIQDVLDDLEEAARIDAALMPMQPEKVDCALLLARLMSTLDAAAADKDVLLALSIAPRCAPVLIDPRSAERMTTRLLGAALGLAREGERIEVQLHPGDGPRPETVIAVTRPQLVSGHDEQALLDASEIDGEEDGAPPVLGLGFTLRLVRSIADACGGRLVFTPDQFCLRLPAAQAQGGNGSRDDTEAALHGDRDWAEWVRRNAQGAACHAEAGSAIARGPGGACSSMVELAAHNGLVGGSNPSGPTGQHEKPPFSEDF